MDKRGQRQLLLRQLGFDVDSRNPLGLEGQQVGAQPENAFHNGVETVEQVASLEFPHLFERRELAIDPVIPRLPEEGGYSTGYHIHFTDQVWVDDWVR